MTSIAVALFLIVASVSPNTTLRQKPAKWEAISDGILAELGKSHRESSDPYAVKTAGISVDRTNGDVYLLANNIGICKSSDQGQTFRLVSGDAVSGRFETSGGLNIDPSGGRLMCFSIYGASGFSSDGGKTWSTSTLGHLDFGAVDWSDSGKVLLAICHESGGKLVFSQDRGKTWSTVGKDHWGVGLFDRKTLLTSDIQGRGIQRSVDGGLTWTNVCNEPLAAPVMAVFNRTGYWLGENGLLTSNDSGRSWRLAGPLPKGASLGPLFGRDARHIVVGATEGIFESSDAGKSWKLLAPLAPDIPILKAGRYATYGWDPIHNIVYASQMAKPAYRLVLDRD